MFGLFKFLLLLAKNFYRLLDPNLNGMRNAPGSIKYIASVLLACFWALAFSLYVGEIWYLGYNVFGHMAVISMAFLTWMVIRTIQQQYPDRPRFEQLRQPDRAQRDYEITEEERQALIKRSTT